MDATDDSDERCPHMLPCPTHGDLERGFPSEAPRWFRKKVEHVLFGDETLPEVAIHGRFKHMSEWECGGIMVRCMKRMLDLGMSPMMILMVTMKTVSNHGRG